MKSEKVEQKDRREWKTIRKTISENCFRATQVLLLGIWVKEIRKNRRFTKSIIKKISPQTEGPKIRDWKSLQNAQHNQAGHWGIQMAAGRTEDPPSSQKVGQKSHKQRSGSQKGMSFLNSNPETRRQWEIASKIQTAIFLIYIYIHPDHPSGIYESRLLSEAFPHYLCQNFSTHSSKYFIPPTLVSFLFLSIFRIYYNSHFNSCYCLSSLSSFRL